MKSFARYLLTLCSICYGLASFGGTVYIKIISKGGKDTAAVISQRALAGVDKHLTTSIANPKGGFVALPYEPGMQLSLIAKGRTSPLHLSPGDSLTITIDSAITPQFAGKRAADNAWLTEFWQIFHTSYKTENLRTRILENTIDQFEIWLYSKRKEETTWIGKQDISPQTKEHLEAYTRFWYWGSLLSYPVEKANAAPQNPVNPIPPVMLEGLDAAGLNDPKLLEISAFRDFLTYYITYNTSEANHFLKFTDVSTSAERKSAMAYSKIKGEAAVFVAAKQLSDNAPKLSEPIAKRLLGLLEEKDAGRHYVRFVAPQLKAILAAKPKENKPKEEKASPAGKSDYPFVLKNIEGKEVSLESFKGKVVYLDFWASWCGPCRQMFPFSKQLHEKLSDKQKKQIAFVYISIDGTPEAWKTALEQLDLSNGINLHSPGNWQSEVVKYFQINSIPRYMIFDKKGILVDSNAKRPADPALLDDLLKLTE